MAGQLISFTFQCFCFYLYSGKLDGVIAIVCGPYHDQIEGTKSALDYLKRMGHNATADDLTFVQSRFFTEQIELLKETCQRVHLSPATEALTAWDSPCYDVNIEQIESKETKTMKTRQEINAHYDELIAALEGERQRELALIEPEPAPEPKVEPKKSKPKKSKPKKSKPKTASGGATKTVDVESTVIETQPMAEPAKSEPAKTEMSYREMQKFLKGLRDDKGVILFIKLNAKKSVLQSELARLGF